jgi:hypothetical protein
MGSVDFFDFNQQGNPAVHQDPFQILPGDSFQLKCFYSNAEPGRVFGLSSQDEMCISVRTHLSFVVAALGPQL